MYIYSNHTNTFKNTFNDNGNIDLSNVLLINTKYDYISPCLYLIYISLSLPPFLSVSIAVLDAHFIKCHTDELIGFAFALNIPIIMSATVFDTLSVAGLLTKV